MANKKVKSVRLSEDIIPVKYNIHLIPDLDNFTFQGSETINIKLAKPTSQITIHSAELEITTVEISYKGKDLVGKVSYDDKEETATLSFSEKIPSGNTKLKLSFTGILNDKMRGFYRSSYEMEGKEYHMGVTQFESTDARRAFPCFDEPAKKAIFEISLKIPNDRTLISNTIESEILEHEDGYKTIKFAPSPKMSSYLLAFIVGHFESIKKKTKDGVLVRVFTTPGKLPQAKFALDVAVKCIEFYEDFFGIPYPLPTMDLIAIPDFAAGAMENWGAVTYRESALLVDENLSSTQNKQWVALVIAHELAHQWFGNLVTMEWWTHLWLNEGFASYMEYVAIDSLYPEWNVWSQFVYIEHSRALVLDGLANTHPIEVEVSHPAEISEIFDAVSYSKGASVIRMLAEYMGKNSFKKGLRAYLKKYKYSNAKTTDLWDCLEKVSGKKIGDLMNAWTRKPGYPLVELSDKNGRLLLSQKRFFSSLSSNKKNKDKQIWPIPINILTSKSTKPSFFIFDKESLPLDPKLNHEPFIKLNARETSFIRVDYGTYLTKLEVPLASGNRKFKPSDRFGIIRDAFALSEAGQLPVSSALKLTLSYTHEESYNVWAEIASDLGKISSIISDEPYYEAYRRYAVRVFSRIGKHLSWEKKKGESHSHTILRSLVLYSLGTYGDEATIKKAMELFEKEISGKGSIASDVRGVVFNLVAENGGEKEYEKILGLFQSTKLEEERDRLLRALCLFRDKKLIKKSLTMAFGEGMHGQDSLKAISFILSNRFGRDIAWDYLKSSWGPIVKRFSGGHLYNRFLQPLGVFSDNNKADEIKNFFKDKDKTGLERTINQVLEQIESNASWKKRDNQDLSEFLSQF
ncbi:MAG TPA: M1 family metallopeptidase [Patescibacteria group bacterium]|nr:M1 family metallopeptidase [Patescibacteria group bacterium]